MLNYEDLLNNIIKDIDETLELIYEQNKELEKLYELLSQQ